MSALSLPLRIRLRSGRFLPLRRRSRLIPRYWRRVDDGRDRFPSYHTIGQWELVLSSRNTPYMLVRCGQNMVFYTPPLAEGVARAELAGFSAEGRIPPPPPPRPAHRVGNWAVLLFLGLLCWHGLRMGWWDLPGRPNVPDDWVNAGALDGIRWRIYHEWYRVVTALTLHADSQHLLGNIAFGSIFLTLLCRRAGLGAGLFLTVLGGALGNICTALFRSLPFVSLGFSTALFASVGALSGSLAVETHRNRGKALVPLAAGAALLAMLGTEGERVDYTAHIWGLLAGFSVGMALQLHENRHAVPAWGQWLLGTATVVLLVGAWVCALA